jgi:hypothetical protein
MLTAQCRTAYPHREMFAPQFGPHTEQTPLVRAVEPDADRSAGSQSRTGLSITREVDRQKPTIQFRRELESEAAGPPSP